MSTNESKDFNTEGWPQLSTGAPARCINYTELWKPEDRAEEYRRRGEYMWSKEVLHAESQ